MGVNVFNFSFNHSLGEIQKLAGLDIVLVGNIPPRDVLAAGTPDQVIKAVKKASGETENHDRIVWSTGGGMPPDVRNENINAFIKAVKEYT
jgi:uroporphyrinogen decarboxylase